MRRCVNYTVAQLLTAHSYSWSRLNARYAFIFSQTMCRHGATFSDTILMINYSPLKNYCLLALHTVAIPIIIELVGI